MPTHGEDHARELQRGGEDLQILRLEQRGDARRQGGDGASATDDIGEGGDVSDLEGHISSLAHLL